MKTLLIFLLLTSCSKAKEEFETVTPVQTGTESKLYAVRIA